MFEIYSALLVGVLGSFHCIGMCGPLALAIPQRDRRWFMLVRSALLYNGGRAFTYAMMGLVVGAVGATLQTIGFQQGLSIGLGVAILLALFLPNSIKQKIWPDSSLQGGWAAMRRWFGQLLRDPNPTSLLTLGLLNGFLPCGLVYIALGGAMATGHAWEGALYMALFGLGTLPAMTAVAIFGQFITTTTRQKITRLIPVVVGGVAVLLILRGLSLGIPYISPDMHAVAAGSSESCCAKH
ncbi:sulfite exporter TauE/SafE family protein [bacterium]|nr:sulfite exporter TauE/SafE family protein [bacterium]